MYEHRLFNNHSHKGYLMSDETLLDEKMRSTIELIATIDSNPKTSTIEEKLQLLVRLRNNLLNVRSFNQKIAQLYQVEVWITVTEAVMRILQDGNILQESMSITLQKVREQIDKMKQTTNLNVDIPQKITYN